MSLFSEENTILNNTKIAENSSKAAGSANYGQLTFTTVCIHCASPGTNVLFALDWRMMFVMPKVTAFIIAEKLAL